MPRGIYNRKTARKRRGNVEPIKSMEIKIGSEIVTVSGQLGEEIKALTEHVNQFTELYERMTAKKAEFADRFMDGFSLFNRETGRSFVDFVRAVDPSVPADREGYRNHRTYQAAEYLRRSQTRRGGGGGARGTAPTRTNAVGRMARLLATILAVVDESDHEAIWRGLGEELELRPRQLSNLKDIVSKVQPLIKLPIKKPIHAEIVHTEQPQSQAA